MYKSKSIVILVLTALICFGCSDSNNILSNDSDSNNILSNDNEPRDLLSDPELSEEFKEGSAISRLLDGQGNPILNASSIENVNALVPYIHVISPPERYSELIRVWHILGGPNHTHYAEADGKTIWCRVEIGEFAGYYAQMAN